MDYRTILVQTWKILWKHKAIMGFGYLPFLVPGLFALFVIGVFIFSPMVGWEHFASLTNDYPFLWLAIFIMVVLLSIGSTAVGYAGVLKGMVYAYTEAETVSFKDLWFACWPFVGRLLGMLLSTGFLISLITIFPALLGILTAGVAFLCLLPFLFLIIPLSFLLQAAISLGMSAIVSDDLGMLAAFQRTGRFFRSNFWSSFLMALILYTLQTLVGFFIYSPLTVVQWLFIFLWWKNNISPGSTYMAIGLVSVIVILLILAVQGIVTTYIQSVWTFTYLRLSKNSAPSWMISV